MTENIVDINHVIPISLIDIDKQPHVFNIHSETIISSQIAKNFNLKNCNTTNIFSRIHSKPLNIQWIRTGYHPNEKKVFPTSYFSISIISTNIKMYNYNIKTIF